ncbi:MAG: amidohydrolase family protein [Acidobacteriota bacterium]
MRILAFLMVLCLVSCRQGGEPQTQGEAQPAERVVKYGVTVETGPMDSILVKDYMPNSSLVVPETHIPKARFPVIDVHAHVEAETPEEVDDWVRTMDEVGVEVTLILTGATGERFDRLVDLYLKSYPGRFQLYCGLDINDISAPDYPERVVRELVRCYEKGARGVGEVSDKGWGIGRGSENPLPRDQRLHPDDPRLDAVWEKCAELNLPVILHIADHPSCWEPLGPTWERTPDFQAFNLYGKDVPSYEELLASRDRLLSKHPRTTLIACHLSNQGNDLGALSQVLERYPNLYLDISARDYEIGRQPKTAGRFFRRHKDRIVFGTDMGLERHMYEGWWRLLETADEFIPGRLWWRYYGLELQEDVLQGVYRDNARRILNWKRVQAASAD